MNHPALLEKIKSLNQVLKQSLRKPSGEFVGAVLDLSSPQDVDRTALIVGINYGQRRTSIAGINAESLKYAAHAKVIGREPFQTVLWNFFPYLTDSAWLKGITNRADEADRLFNGGYQDPLAALKHVSDALNPDIIIFHGLNSAVPLLAHLSLKHTQAKSVFLVPNLSWPLDQNKIRQLR